MYEITDTFVKSELDYRSDRVRSGMAGTKGRRHPSWVCWVRRVQSSGASC